MSRLVPGETTCSVISTLGFLGRDFKRRRNKSDAHVAQMAKTDLGDRGVAGEARSELEKGRLSPAPYLLHFKRSKKPGRGYVGLLYQKRRITDPTTGAPVFAQSPIPRGVSGGPMLDTVKLGEGVVAIIGVFTAYKKDRGLAYGETAQKVIDLLGSYELRPK